MNNANFGVDCRNNVNNSTFDPIIDEINEISYLKKYYSLFNNKISGFVNSEVLEKEMEQKFKQGVSNIQDNVSKTYAKNNIIKCCLYLNMADTDSCSFFIVFICKLEC